MEAIRLLELSSGPSIESLRFLLIWRQKLRFWKRESKLLIYLLRFLKEGKSDFWWGWCRKDGRDDGAYPQYWNRA